MAQKNALTRDQFILDGLGRCDKMTQDIQKALEISEANRLEAWEAMDMIREAIETLGPVGAVKAVEYVLPGFINEAKALIEGIQKLSKE